MSEDAPPIPVLSLTAEMVRGWYRDRAAEQAHMAECAARIEVWDRKLAAVAVLLDDATRSELFGDLESAGSAKADQVSPDSVSVKGKRTLEIERKEWVTDLIREAGVGLTENEVWERAREHRLPDGSEETSRTIRALIENLSRRGRLRRRGLYIYHPEVLLKIETGEIEDRPKSIADNKSDIRGMIRKALLEIGAASAKNVIAQLWKMEEALPVMRRNPQYPYTMLSRMAQSGELDREGAIYHLPRELSGIETDGSSGNTNVAEAEG